MALKLFQTMALTFQNDFHKCQKYIILMYMVDIWSLVFIATVFKNNIYVNVLNVHYTVL